MTQDPNAPGSVPPASTPPSGGVPLDSSPSGPYAGPAPTKDEQNMAVLCYILGIVTWIIGPLIIWLMKKDSSKFIDDQGKEVINFEITAALASVALIIVAIILHFIPYLGAILVILLRLGLFAAVVVLNIMGAMSVSKGTAYRYPFSLRLIK
jgi:uncharacterized Tic20 family protein